LVLCSIATSGFLLIRALVAENCGRSSSFDALTLSTKLMKSSWLKSVLRQTCTGLDFLQALVSGDEFESKNMKGTRSSDWKDQNIK